MESDDDENLTPKRKRCQKKWMKARSRTEQRKARLQRLRDEIEIEGGQQFHNEVIAISVHHAAKTLVSSLLYGLLCLTV